VLQLQVHVELAFPASLYRLVPEKFQGTVLCTGKLLNATSKKTGNLEHHKLNLSQ
jgi:hypothetical protein